MPKIGINVKITDLGLWFVCDDPTLDKDDWITLVAEPEEYFLKDPKELESKFFDICYNGIRIGWGSVREGFKIYLGKLSRIGIKVRASAPRKKTLIPSMKRVWVFPSGYAPTESDFQDIS